MRVLTLSGLTAAALFTAACGGADKPAETPAAETPAVGATTTPAVEAPAPAAEPTAAPAAVPAPAAVTYASLTGDAAKGEKVFAQCKACHVAEEGKNRVGPSLWAVVGRTAGSIAGFNYSKANKESGVTWSEDVLFTYLEAPAKFMPGTRMAFAGLKNPQDRADVIAYLKTNA
ncbi:cytochrome c family protein [Sandarakinorhabdus sp. AAP62]|uniref:c-type cytochrome n=1 Tax=Sandarakinorhabdus sp. AAP62 TaxID=1248916 RepID=UPI0002EF3D90|nr:cytochrome c family protein [Sandarakinorhabdus sp. AAP62]